ncbi:MAG: AsmA family protein [Thermodesulfobacteriota bacterium]
MQRPVKLAIIAAGCVAALFAGLMVLGLSLDPGVFKGRISKAVKDTAGMDVSFDGPIKVAYFPSLGVQLEKVTVLSPPQAGGGVLMKLAKAAVSVKLMPLLSGKVETGEITVDGLELNLVRDEQGRLNLPVPPVKEVKVEGEKVVVVTETDERYSIDYQIDAVTITNTLLTYDDRMTRNRYAIRDFTLSSGKVVRGQPFKVSLGFGYSVAEPEVTGRVDLSGQGKAVLEAMQFAFEDASFKTSASGKGLPFKEIQAEYTGAARVDLNNKTFAGEKLKLVATGKGGVLPDAGAGFNLAMDVKSDMKAGTADVTGLALDIMGFVLSGEIHADGLEKAPKMRAAMATNEFNPSQVLGKFGVKLQDAGTAKASFNASADLEKGTAELTGVKINALGLDITSDVYATNVTGEQQVSGKVSLAEFNPRQLMAKLGQPLPGASDPSALTRLRIAYAFEGKGEDFSLRTTDFKLDDTTMSLTMNVKKAATPKIDFAFKADAVNLDRYSPPAGAARKEEAAGKKAGKPVDVPAEVTGSVDIGRLTASKLHMQNLSARLSIKDNILNVNPASVSLYQGSVKASLRAGVRGGPTAPLAVNVNADGIQVEQLLKDMQGKSSISGRASLNAALTAKGQEADQILSTLDGRASFALRKGVILGVNLSPDLLQSPQKLLTGQGGQGGTPIESVTGSFAIDNGVASNKDFVAVIPPHRATGQGWINLPAETLDYRLTMNFAKLAPVPVHLTGKLDSPDVAVDPAALAAALAKGVVETIQKNPQELLKPENLGKGALDALGGILGAPRKK